MKTNWNYQAKCWNIQMTKCIKDHLLEYSTHKGLPILGYLICVGANSPMQEVRITSVQRIRLSVRVVIPTNTLEWHIWHPSVGKEGIRLGPFLMDLGFAPTARFTPVILILRLVVKELDWILSVPREGCLVAQLRESIVMIYCTYRHTLGNQNVERTPNSWVWIRNKTWNRHDRIAFLRPQKSGNGMNSMICDPIVPVCL